MPVPPVQGTREPAGLLWRTWPGTPHGRPDRWKSGSPGVPGHARSTFCDGPELRDRQTRELIYKIISSLVPHLTHCHSLMFTILNPCQNKEVFSFGGLCEDLLHTFTTKICTHNKTRLEVELRCSCSLTSKVVRGK